MAEPSEEELRTMIRQVVAKVDLESTGIKKFIAELSKEFGGVDLMHKKKFIKQTLTEVINEDNQDDDDDSSDDDDEDDSSDDEPASKKAKRSGGGGGLNKVKEISPELSAFFGGKKEMARTEIVKGLWEYIRQHDLQNPDNKREIILDDKMRQVFLCDTFTMFTMNKYVGAHIDPFKPVDLTPKPKTPRKRKAKGEKKKRTGGSTGGGFQVPYRLSQALVDVVGYEVLSRPQVSKQLWVYIRKHELQNEKDKREILCDDKLKKVMENRSKVTMFSMNKYITPHLIEKVDPSEYTPPQEE